MERKASASSKEGHVGWLCLDWKGKGMALCFLFFFSVEERLRKSGTEEGYEGP